jgi:hypothetical protein
MKDLEKLINEADFSKETTQKNQLYYELFRKPVPVHESYELLLNDADLSFVNGGVSRSMPAETLDEESVKNRLRSGLPEQAASDLFEENSLQGEDSILRSGRR